MPEKELKQGVFLDPKANFSQLGRLLVVVVIFVTFFGLIGGAWWVFSKKTGIGDPETLLKPLAQTIQQELTVDPNQQQFYQLEIRRAPGQLSGSFHVTGKSAGIRGATDDTLIGFHIKGPNNEKMNALDRPANGNFSVRVTAPGTYTLVFSNAGIIRSSARKVTVTGRYQPD